ncbi:MAG: hypothetical protein QM704_19945 [Anaeromyxobacteraceae bacterium]
MTSSSLNSFAWSPSSWYWSFSATFAFSSSARSATSRFLASSGGTAARMGCSEPVMEVRAPCFEGRSAAAIVRNAFVRSAGGAPAVARRKSAIAGSSDATSAKERFSGSNRCSWQPAAKSRTSR